ncbi:MAG: hypothetical protein ACKVQC_07770 [Elusimicrobiota bacterium]
MKYMEKGGFQNHPLMKLTLALTFLFLIGFWVTNFLLYFSKMGLTPISVQNYYLGSESEFLVPRSYPSMLEVTHMHLPMMAIVVLLLTHLLIFAPFRYGSKLVFIFTTFFSALLGEAAGWLVRFVNPEFAYLKIISFLMFQSCLAFLLVALLWFLAISPSRKLKSPHNPVL